MPDPRSLFQNPVWHSLLGPHRHLALTTGNAARYPADVSPFGAIAAPTPAALSDLATLLQPDEQIWLAQATSLAHPLLSCIQILPCLQLLLPEDLPLPPASPAIEILPLTPADLPEMLSLINLAYPGFFRPGTPQMGSYFGIRSHGELVAMGGERLAFGPFVEISGLATHPAHRGHGYATSLLWHLAHLHRAHGLRSFLHVTSTNRGAIQLYHRLGFQTVGELTLHHLRRTL